MTPQTNTATHHASEAAEALRALNHATIWPDEKGWVYPGDAYDTLGALAQLASRLPQTLTQMHRLLARTYTSGNLTAAHGDVHAHVSHVELSLIDADQAARDLLTALEQAQIAFSPLGYRE